MNIIGTKVILRAIEPSDNELLLSIINDSDTEYMLGGWSFPVSVKNQEEWIDLLKYDTKILRCIICLKEQNIALGVVMLTNIDYKNGNAEVHIKLANTEVRGKGYGTDAVNAVVKYAFEELRLKLVYARINEYNIASQKMFEKSGFMVEGVLKSRIFKRGKYSNILSLSRESQE
ncbi:MAG: GNAT family N-acetyltransferase [Malacoplasma sp.]